MKGSMVLVIAIVVGALAAVLAKTQIESTITEQTEGLELINVCVAKRRLQPRDIVNIETDIEIKGVPQSLAMNGYVLEGDKHKLDKLTVRVEITKGKLMDFYYFGSLDTLQKGPGDINVNNNTNRLIPIKVTEATGIAGYLNPGDRVDVLHTNKNKKTQMMMQSVLIRYVGTAGTGRGRGVGYSSITVEVQPREAMALTNAMETGTIMLIKRSRSNISKVNLDQVQPIQGDDYQSILEGNN